MFNQTPNGPALPGNEAYGIQWSFEGRFAVFVGGFPIVVNGEVVGGIGLSGGNGEQDIACGVAHRVLNPRPDPLAFIEVQRGSYFGEDDIERLEDDFGRL